MALQPSRRRLLRAAASLPMVVAAAAIPGAGCPAFAATMRAYGAADAEQRRVTDLELDGSPEFQSADDRYISAWRAALVAVPTTWAEFVQLLDVITEGGTDTTPTQEATAHLLAQAQRLLREGR